MRLWRGRGDQVSKETIWALKDISFTIEQGEVVGIIGHNGAGKSTLLKILSRITAPSSGEVAVRGRVASLLEVGTGFHPELTGRENIFLNGAILGMTRREVQQNFDEILDFAGVERFVDTPVKHYSSGMYMRLAFAIAAHLETDVLLVDEVLAVGDASFQQKCLAKMQDVAGQGRTVLFVSHNLSAISALCQKGIYFQHGRVVATGPIHEVLASYSQGSAMSGQFERPAHPAAEAILVWGGILYNLLLQCPFTPAEVNLVIFARKDVTASVDFRLKDALGVPVGLGHSAHFSPLKWCRCEGDEQYRVYPRRKLS